MEETGQTTPKSVSELSFCRWSPEAHGRIKFMDVWKHPETVEVE